MRAPDPDLALAYGLFTAGQACAAGVTRAEILRHVRRGRWERLDRGVLQVAGRAPRPGDAIVRAVLAAPSGAVVGFETAAMIHGWELSDEPSSPQLIKPKNGRYPDGLTSPDVMICGIVQVTTPHRTALDLACGGGDAAVVALDSAMRAGGVCREELWELFAASHRRGIRQGRDVLSRCDPSSGSVPETQARLLFAAAGLPTPVSQLVVDIDGRIVARADFGWPAAMLLVEIDGFGPHSGRTAFQGDRTRQNRLLQAGWLVLRFTVEDIRLRPRLVVAEVRRALARAR